MTEFERIIGIDKLKAVHVNDCKCEFYYVLLNVDLILADLNSHLDRHENIGMGMLKNCWQFFMNDSRFDNIPLILETPEGKYPSEMKELYKMDEK